jgi:hypothetical protein
VVKTQGWTTIVPKDDPAQTWVWVVPAQGNHLLLQKNPGAVKAGLLIVL